MTGRIVNFRTSRAEPPEARRGGPRRTSPAWGGSNGGAFDSDPASAARFRLLVLPHLGAAYSLARYLCRDAVAAEDIAQEAMLKAYRGFAGLRGGDAKPWLLAIVRNAYFDWIRRNRGWEGLTAPAPGADDMSGIADPDQPSPESRLIQRGDVDALRAAIEAIPEPFREALVLRALEEMPYAAIAQVTGVPLGTVMSRLARARALLGRALGMAEDGAP